MRGNPILEFVCFALAWLLLLLPLGIVTRREPQTGASAFPAETQSATRAAWLRLVFQEPPRQFMVRSGDQLIWEQVEPDADEELLVELVWQMDRPALHVQAIWDVPGRRVVEIRVSPADGGALQTTLWRSGDIDESVVFP